MKASDTYGKRLQRLTRAIQRQRLDAFLVWNRANTRYLSGFQGTASLICLTPQGGYFLTDFRYSAIARASVEHLRIVQTKPPANAQLARILKRHRAKRIGFEESVPFRVYESWRKDLNGSELVETTALIRGLRECKTREEVRLIVQAQRIVEGALERVLAQCRPGVTERHLARRVLHAIEDEGGDEPSFDPIVASGPHAALPHHRPGERRLKERDFVLFDLGVRKDGYASDMTRTVVLGRPTERQRRIYQTVLQAQRKAIAKMRAGVDGRKVDRAARAWIEAQGFGRNFGHGTGHGVGLDVHESPNLSPESSDILRPGMVVTVEPGIYLLGWGGVRIEDMVWVKRDGREVLGRFPKNLIACPCR